MTKKIKKICSRGHVFYKSSDCPVCPKCWAGYYKKREKDEFATLTAPARRALKRENINKLTHLTKRTQSELLRLHGFGPHALRTLRKIMSKHKLEFLEK